jgi:MtN3 and saliva related transmembrane protein
MLRRAIKGGMMVLNRDYVHRTIRCGLLGLSAVIAGGCEQLGVRDTWSLLVPTLHRSELAGIIAGFGTTFAAVPDLIGMLRRRSSKGINPTMAAILAVFQIVWVYYGLLILSRPVIVWNVIAVLINSLTVGAYFRFARRERHAVAATSK